jgi:hypothetical protein
MKHFNSLRLLHLFFALLAVSVTLSTRAETDEYLKGYLDALLDQQFPDTDISVLTLHMERREAILTMHGCISKTQQQEIESVLIKSERVRAVIWEGAFPCGAEPATAVAAQTPAPAKTTAPVTVKALPKVELFDPLIADPRQPQFAIRYQYYKTPATTFNAASLSVGDYFPFATGLFGTSGSSQIGIQGAVFALFNLDSPSHDLINADYWVGLPISYRQGRWSFLGRIYHQSSHLGDEFLLDTPGVNRINLSYEESEVLASYDWRKWRFYAGGGYILHSEPKLRPWTSQYGIEFLSPYFIQELDLIAAVDWQAKQEQGWRLNRSYQLGLAFHRGDRQVRLMLEHFQGFSPNGQFYRDRLRYSGLGIYFDL